MRHGCYGIPCVSDVSRVASTESRQVKSGRLWPGTFGGGQE